MLAWLKEKEVKFCACKCGNTQISIIKEKILSQKDPNPYICYWVRCPNLDCEFMSSICDTEADAIRDWNAKSTK